MDEVEKGGSIVNVGMRRYPPEARRYYCQHLKLGVTTSTSPVFTTTSSNAGSYFSGGSPLEQDDKAEAEDRVQHSGETTWIFK